MPKCLPEDDPIARIPVILDFKLKADNMKHIVGTAMLMYLMACGLSAQTRLDLPVQVEGQELSAAWAGGLNAPQFSNIDFNRDGIQDLVVFDRQGDQLLTYIRTPATGRWILDRSYASIFPRITDWLLIRDYDGDGVEDLFTSSTDVGVPGVSVYKGAVDGEGAWSFVRQSDRGQPYLQVSAGASLTNLYVSWDDIPAIDDIDGDGDLDILAFEPGGSFISYFRNQSEESGWGRDSLRFTLADVCWGKILENELTEEVYLSDDPTQCSDGNIAGDPVITPRHAGSTVMTLDWDLDGDKDAFVGDISSRRLVRLTNGLNAQSAWMTEQDSQYPSGDVSVDLPYFVAGYAVQLDDDPEPELLAAVNSRALTEDRESVWRYDDDPLTDGPLEYLFTQSGFLQDEMIDLGSHARPTLADVNGDGLQDLVVGGYHFTDGSQTRIPTLWLFHQTGTAEAPYFTLVDRDWLGMSQFASLPTFDFAPAFGDLDGNGTFDLVVGDQNGKLFFFRNTAAVNAPVQFDAAVYPYMNISVGVSATPQIIDINRDGLGDLVVGERTGNSDGGGRCSNLNYFENVGSPGSAQFGADPTQSPNTQCFGRLLFDIVPGLPQYSTPAIFETPGGLMLMTGRDDGTLSLYNGVESGVTEPLTLVEANFGQVDVGTRSAPFLVDINGDKEYELWVGNQRGGLELFGTTLSAGSVSVTEPVRPDDIRVRVIDPAGIFEIAVTGGQGQFLAVYDGIGRILADIESVVESGSVLNLRGYPSGYYVVQVKLADGRWVAVPVVKTD